MTTGRVTQARPPPWKTARLAVNGSPSITRNKEKAKAHQSTPKHAKARSAASALSEGASALGLGSADDRVIVCNAAAAPDALRRPRLDRQRFLGVTETSEKSCCKFATRLDDAMDIAMAQCVRDAVRLGGEAEFSFSAARLGAGGSWPSVNQGSFPCWCTLCGACRAGWCT
ncbi:hypothetical protein K458DRAFT_432497 [Lentithecium fluviatile CBS 122367]|uniref:Uncharacterized protein n=1 Tax=Lentithecium fluviatile CBS 122367 TaxID=1168545 RepID=A0A6G1IXZ6_9PLEO|nr:hypothetical protein K458DRAFT_432497 [Lentithecium fluviatile CBS 122367]